MKLLVGMLLVVGCAGMACAQTAEERATLAGIGVIRAHAQSTTRLPNTVADASVGIEVTGKDLSDVTMRLSQQSTQLIQSLRSMGAERLQTGEVNFQPQNHTAKSGDQSIVGYTGSTTVSFRTTPEKLGAALSGALGNGANRVESTTLHPSEAEADAARQSLADEATRRALAEAESVAKVAGERVISVKEITVDQPATPVRPFMYAAAFEQRSAVSAPLPPIAISAGEAEMTVSVAVAVNISH